MKKLLVFAMIALFATCIACQQADQTPPPEAAPEAAAPAEEAAPAAEEAAPAAEEAAPAAEQAAPAETPAQ
ncbi:MAG: hypothetical protein ACOZBW_06205 [Thermodesulfobacteriota bacterium]